MQSDTNLCWCTFKNNATWAVCPLLDEHNRKKVQNNQTVWVKTEKENKRGNKKDVWQYSKTHTHTCTGTGRVSFQYEVAAVFLTYLQLLSFKKEVMDTTTLTRPDRHWPTIRDECAAACGAEISESRRRDGNVSAPPCRTVRSGFKSERRGSRERRLSATRETKQLEINPVDSACHFFFFREVVRIRKTKRTTSTNANWIKSNFTGRKWTAGIALNSLLKKEKGVFFL